ncbi:MAG: NADPH-dependent FMN reductase [Gemmatimonadaceae bacterium]
MLRILGIAGSLRRGSFNRQLLGVAQQLTPPDTSFVVFERLGDLPHYNADIDGPEAPGAVGALRDAIRECEGLVIASPEYNYSIPGVLKNAIDWASRPPATSPLTGKPILLMGASTGLGGTARAQLALRQAFVFTKSYVLPAPEILVARAAEKFAADGTISDQATLEFIRGGLARLSEFARKLSS